MEKINKLKADQQEEKPKHSRIGGETKIMKRMRGY